MRMYYILATPGIVKPPPSQQLWQIWVTVACSLTIVGILVGVLINVVKRKRGITWYPQGYQLQQIAGMNNAQEV